MTEWESARSFLEKFAFEIERSIPPYDDYLSVFVPSENVALYDGVRQQIYEVSNGIIESIELDIINLVPYGDLTTMMKTYGRPGEVWIASGARYTRPDGKTTDFFMILFYPDQGILASYEDALAEIGSDSIVGCPDLPGHGLEMLLWNPKNVYTFQERLKKSTVFPEEEPLIPLEEATGITLDAYYQSIIAENSQCLHTPIDIWP